MINDVILSLLITSVAAIIALFIRYSFYSKCDNIKCCCCEVHRAVNAEQSMSDIENQSGQPKLVQSPSIRVESKPFSTV